MIREIKKLKILINDSKSKREKLALKIKKAKDTFMERSLNWQESLKGQYWKEKNELLDHQLDRIDRILDSWDETLEDLERIEE
tara:strand:- start:1083 stop:1331 length:249 start_codon:yes stop_codon:yes gene_type:complete